MRSGLIISAVGHGVLSAVLLATSPALPQATDTQPINVELVSADQASRQDVHSQTEPSQGSPGHEEPAAPAKVASADTLIRAPEIRDAPKAPAKPSPQRSAPAQHARSDPERATSADRGDPAVPVAAMPGVPGPQLDLPSAPAAESSSQAPPMGKPADMAVLPLQAAPQEAPPRAAGAGGPDEPDGPAASSAAAEPPVAGSPAPEASPAPAPAEPPQPAADERQANSSWYALLADMPVIVAGEPSPPTSERARAEIATFKAHLKKCWKLKPTGGSDPAAVFRVFLRPNGALAKDPMLLIAPPPSSGLALVEAAVRALKQCQPYGGLPAADYNDWKVLDLRLSAAEMAGG